MGLMMCEGKFVSRDEIAMVQTLDNLRRDGTLEIIDYLERIPDKLIPRKAGLIAQMRERMGQAAEKETSRAADGDPLMLVGGPLSEDKMLAKLPVGMQAGYSALPKVAQRTLRKMGESGA